MQPAALNVFSSVCLQDADDRGGDAESGSVGNQATVSFSQLYEALGKGLTTERSVLLLYALLYGCPPFRVRSLVHFVHGNQGTSQGH